MAELGDIYDTAETDEARLGKICNWPETSEEEQNKIPNNPNGEERSWEYGSCSRPACFHFHCDMFYHVTKVRIVLF